MQAKLSAIIITKNEEKNIARCLDSIQWVDEVIVIDSDSKDRTESLARTYNNVRFFTEAWKGYSENKRIAVSKTSHNWVLWIDADEVVSSELRAEIIEKLNKPLPEQVIFDCPRKTFFLGTWIRHTGWYPGRVRRLFNKKYCRFNNNILHEGLEVQGNFQTSHLSSDLLHYSYTSLHQYFDKMNFYGKFGAEELIRKGKKFYFFQLLINPLVTFLKFFFLKKGFLDGKYGFIISVGSAFSNFIKYANFYYLRKNEKDNHQ